MSYAQEIGRAGSWTFYRTTDAAGFAKDGPLYGFTMSVPDGTAAGKPKIGEWYDSIEHAMAAAIAEKYTGRRGAGGPGVGTAADWFMRMIGADVVEPTQEMAEAYHVAELESRSQPWKDHTRYSDQEHWRDVKAGLRAALRVKP